MRLIPVTYRSLFGAPGVPRLILAALIGRLPVGVISLGLVLFVHASYGGFARAGAVAAGYAIAQGVVSPPLGRLVDRIGQGRMLAIAGPLSSVALVGAVVAGLRHAPIGVVIGLAALSGASRPPLSACLRRMLSAKLGAGPELDSAYALESALVEVISVSGPLLTTGLAAAGSPAAALLAAAAMTLIGTLCFAASPDVRRWRPVRQASGWAGALASPGMRTLIAATLVGGAGLGALEVALPAFASRHGGAAGGGLALAAMSLTSLGAGLWYGARRFDGPVRTRYLGLTALSALTLLPSILASSLPAMIALMGLTGLSQAPLGTCTYTLIDRLAPDGTLTEAFTWLTASTVAGAALGNAVAGMLSQTGGARLGLAVAAVSGVAAFGISWTRRRTLHVRPAPVAA